MALHLYDTTDYRRFLRAALEGRGLTGVDFSRTLGRSEAWLSMVLKGRRPLDPEMVEPVATALRLDGEETAYFAALVDLHSRSDRSRRLAWATVHATQRHLAQASLDSAVALLLLSKWYVGAIAELSRCEGFRADPRWIARTLVPPIEPTEAEQALTALLRLGILVPDDHGGLRCERELSWSPSELPRGEVSRAVAEHQRAMLGMAAGVLDWTRQNERHTSSATFAIPEEVYATLVGRLRELERELLLLTDVPAAPNRVYQLGIQLFPISLYTDADPDQSIEASSQGAPPDIDPDTTE